MKAQTLIGTLALGTLLLGGCGTRQNDDPLGDAGPGGAASGLKDCDVYIEGDHYQCYHYVGRAWTPQVAKNHCTNISGAEIAQCPAEGRLGICKLRQGASDEIDVHMYPFGGTSSADAATICSDQGGSWKAD
ncbi:MAG: hypothetical protein ACK4N5_19555 [Myxococcales bacterium]